MFIKNFKAAFGLALPVLSLFCGLILGGCGDDTSMVDPNDQVVLDPTEVGISPGDKPVAITATWKSTKSGGTFEKWTAGSDPDAYTLRIDAGKEKQSPTTINVECSPTLIEKVNMHTFGGAYTSQATVTAQLQRDGVSKTIKNILTINVLAPFMKLEVTSSTRK